MKSGWINLALLAVYEIILSVCKSFKYMLIDDVKGIFLNEKGSGENMQMVLKVLISVN